MLARSRPALLALALLGSAVLAARIGPQPVTGQELDVHVHLPVTVRGLAGAFPPVATAPAAPPSATYAPTPTRAPTPTPTWEPVFYPAFPDTIILQIGYTGTPEFGDVWDEMSGTPWLTLYGDGRLIAGAALPDREQNLFESQLSTAEVRAWLNELVTQAQVLSLPDEVLHPRSSQPSLHIYVNADDTERQASIKGIRDWERSPATSEPYNVMVQLVIRFVRRVEAELVATTRTPYAPEKYTVVTQLSRGIVTDPPLWPSGVAADLRAIAESAPRVAPSPMANRLPGHLFVGPELGLQVWSAVQPVADSQWAFYNRAAIFAYDGAHYAVGARKEVPGGSRCLPPDLHERWYRADEGSGEPP